MFLKTIDLVIRKSRRDGGFIHRLTNRVPAYQGRLVLSCRSSTGGFDRDFGPDDINIWYRNDGPRTAAEYVCHAGFGPRKFSDEQREAIKMFVSSGSSREALDMLDVLVEHWREKDEQKDCPLFPLAESESAGFSVPTRRLEAAVLRYLSHDWNDFHAEESPRADHLRDEIRKYVSQIGDISDAVKTAKDVDAMTSTAMCEVTEAVNHAIDELYGVKCQ